MPLFLKTIEERRMNVYRSVRQGGILHNSGDNNVEFDKHYIITLNSLLFHHFHKSRSVNIIFFFIDNYWPTVKFLYFRKLDEAIISMYTLFF